MCKRYGTAVAEARRTAKLSLRELSRMIGITAGYLSRIETNGDLPGPTTICDIANALRCSRGHMMTLAIADHSERSNDRIEKRYAAALRQHRSGDGDRRV